MSHSIFPAKIQGFQGTNALVHLPEHNHVVPIPIQALPQNVKEGDDLTFKVLTPEAQAHEYQNMASAALEMLLNH